MINDSDTDLMIDVPVQQNICTYYASIRLRRKAHNLSIPLYVLFLDLYLRQANVIYLHIC